MRCGALAIGLVVVLGGLPIARAADMRVSGQVAPVLGVAADGSGAGTVATEITREQRGDLTIVTVYPR